MNIHIDFLNELKFGLNEHDKKTRKKNEKKFRNALKDLTQVQRAHLSSLFRVKGNVDSSMSESVCETLIDYQKKQAERELAGLGNSYFSVRPADNPRVKSIWKSFLRGLSNIGSRISSKELLKIIEKSNELSHFSCPSDEDQDAFSLKFNPDQFKLLKVVLMTNKVKNEGGVFVRVKIDEEFVDLIITYDEDNKIINTQIIDDTPGNNNKIGLKIKKGKVETLYIDGQEHHDAEGRKSLEIPHKYLPFVDACYNESLKLSSKYRGWNNRIEIKLVGEGLEKTPGFHLEQLTKKIVTSMHPTSLDITFIGHNLEKGEAIDAGGPAREYLDSLGRGLLKNPPVKLNKNFGDLAFPIAGEKIPGGIFSKLTDQEMEVYLQIGQLLMFCYRSNNEECYSTGQILAFPVIQAALSLNAAEIDKPFDTLNDQSLKKMLESIVSSLVISNPGDGAAGILNNYNLALNLYDWKKGDPIPPDDVLKAAHGLMGNSLLGDEFIEHSYYEYMNEDTYAPEYQKIKDHIEDFVDKAKQGIVTQQSDFMPPIVDYLACSHQLAAGMKSVCSSKTSSDKRWDRGFMHLVDFNDKVQGSLDRKKISQLIKDGSLGNPKGVMKKSQWLREWIETEATNQEVEAFLKFMTGSSSIGPTTQLKILIGYGRMPMPISHSCSNELELNSNSTGNKEYNDRTKEGFIKCLKVVMVQNGALFSMA